MGLELTIPVFERVKTVHALDGAANVMGAVLPSARWRAATLLHISLECDYIYYSNSMKRSRDYSCNPLITTLRHETNSTHRCAVWAYVSGKEMVIQYTWRDVC
jgi:hypothetical protein